MPPKNRTGSPLYVQVVKPPVMVNITIPAHDDNTNRSGRLAHRIYVDSPNFVQCV